MRTKRATHGMVKLFRCYLSEILSVVIWQDFETLPSDELDPVLVKFYVEARTKKGELYKKTTLAAIWYAINRHLQNFTNDSMIYLIKGSAFRESTKAYKAMTKGLERVGKDGVEHHNPLAEAHLVKLSNYLDTVHPQKFMYRVFVYIVFHMACRGRENLRRLEYLCYIIKFEY